MRKILYPNWRITWRIIGSLNYKFVVYEFENYREMLRFVIDNFMSCPGEIDNITYATDEFATDIVYVGLSLEQVYKDAINLLKEEK